MSSPSWKADQRDRVDSLVRQNYLMYSLIQLRLVGIILLLFLAFRLVVALIAVAGADPLNRFETLDGLAPGLILLPLGFGLYLLGGGLRRKPREIFATTLAHQLLLPFGVVCLLVLPILTLHDRLELHNTQTIDQGQLDELVSNHERWLEEASQTSSSWELTQLARTHQIQLRQKGDTSLPDINSIHHFDTILQAKREEFIKEHPVVNLSPYQQELFRPLHVLSSITTEILAGMGLLLLYNHGRSEFKRLGISAAIYFSSNPEPRSPRRSSRKAAGQRATQSERATQSAGLNAGRKDAFS